jgi:hypothetical protein|tara:strand:- start:647 stop:1258 length:612 start_codon:yes stop_codon:yes gene_type:complete
MIIDKEKLIFIHIPKNAGTSVEIFFMADERKPEAGKHAEKHDTIEMIKNKFSNEYETYKKFAIVRNPYDRMVSWYFHLKKEAEKDYAGIWKGFKITIEKSFPFDFAEWVKDPFKTLYTKWKLSGETSNLLNNHQHVWVDETVNILKYENLNKELNDFLKRRIDLPRKNESSHDHYLKYYDKHSLDIVYERYKEDFEKFNYKKL